MSLQKIKESLIIARECQHGFSWVDEEFSDLLILLAEHILQQEDLLYHQLPDGYISLKCFEEKYKLVSAHTLGNYCRTNPTFIDCALFLMDKWWVNEQNTLEFLSKKTFFKKRIERLGKSW